MEQRGCIGISFDKGCVDIIWEGVNALDLLDFLFKDRSRLPDDTPLSLFKLKAETPQSFLLYQAEKLIAKGDRGKVAARLLDSVITELAKETDGGLLFHAAALSSNGRSILIPGKSGSGKTFLAASLADNGYSYLTDEIALVEPDNWCLSGFYKPLHIKNKDAFNYQIPLNLLRKHSIDPSSSSLPVAKGFLTNCFYVNSVKQAQRKQVSIIIFPKYEGGVKPAIKRLACARTGLLLMQNLINSRNLTSGGFHEVADFSRKVPAYQVTYGNCSQVVRAVDSLFASEHL